MLAYSAPGPAPKENGSMNKCTPQQQVPLLYSTRGPWIETSAGLIQHSIVSPPPRPTFRLPLAGTLTAALVVLNRNAWPTSPAPKEAPLSNVPGLESAESAAVPSPRHQLTSPEAVGVH